MFPNLSSLYVMKNRLVDWSQLEDVLNACPKQEKLYLDCYQLSIAETYNFKRIKREEKFRCYLRMIILRHRGDLDLLQLYLRLYLFSPSYVFIYSDQLGMPLMEYLKIVL